MQIPNYLSALTKGIRYYFTFNSTRVTKKNPLLDSTTRVKFWPHMCWYNAQYGTNSPTATESSSKTIPIAAPATSSPHHPSVKAFEKKALEIFTVV